MFSFLKSRREKRERRETLQEIGRKLAEDFKAQIAAFIAIKIVPLRKAYFEQWQGLMANIDQRIKDAEAEAEITREEAAAIDVRSMMDEWDEHAEERLQSARQWLVEEYELAAAAGVADEFHASVENAINEQRLILLTDGMGEINKIAGR